MAVSYLSRNIPLNQYIQPFDLGLLQQINQYKQTNFYKNADALKNEYSQIQNSQIYNPEQKEYFTSKFNNMMQQVQEFGPMDYSDMNITSQLQGIGSSIYNDDIIINGITNTKKIMANQAGWEKINTDPKLMKYSAPQNKAWDDEKIMDYVSGGLHATYDGPTTPTIYQGNPYEKLTASLKNLQPEISVGVDPVTNQPYFMDSENKSLSPDRIQAAMQGALDPATMEQIKIDGWYATRGMSGADLFSQIDKQHKAVIGSYDDAIAQARQQQRVTLGDTTGIEQQIKQLQANRDGAAKKYDPDLIIQELSTKEGRLKHTSNLYTKALFDDATTAYNYNQIDQKLQKLGAKTVEQKNALKENSTKVPPNPLGTGTPLMEPATTFLDEDETKQQSISTKSLDTIISDTQTKRDQLYKDYFLRNNGGKYIKYYQGIAGLDGDPSFSIDDLKKMHNDPAKLANLQLTDDAKQFYNNAWTALVLGQHNAGASIANPKTDLNLLDAQQTMDAVRETQIQADWAKATKQKAYTDTLNQIAAEKGLTSAELEAYKRAVANPTKYLQVSKGTLTPNGISTVSDPLNPFVSGPNRIETNNVRVLADSPVMASAFKKMGKSAHLGVGESVGNYLGVSDEDINKTLFKQSKFKTPQTVFLDGAALAKTHPEAISLLTNGQGIIDKEGNPLDQVPVMSNDIEATAVQKIPFTSKEYANGSRYMVKFNYKQPKGVVATAYKYITGQQANTMFGVPVETENPINDIFEVSNELPPRNVIIPNNTQNGATNLVQTQVVRRGNNPIQILFMLPGGKQTAVLSKMDDGTPFTSAAQAEAYAEIVSRSIVNYPSTEVFLQQLNQHANTH